VAAEILCTRWTIVVLRELVMGTTRFNDLRRGMPRMSPALLSQRLKELEAAGIIERRRGKTDAHEYHLTEAGRELEPIVIGFGVWGQRWIEKDVSLQHLDAQLLMWDMRRNINAEPLPPRRCVIQVQFPEQSAAHANWWLVVEADGEVDLCSVDPGHDVDLFITTDLRTMTAVWMGYERMAKAAADGRLTLTGDAAIARSVQTWLRLSTLAKVERMAS
jgi:DNA-binding HxlR family transcriptional regulator